MWEEILKAIPIYLGSMLKFIVGPVGGYTAGLSLLTTILSTVFGMMTVVFLVTYSGNWLKQTVFAKLLAKRNKFSVKNRRFVTIWKKYGLTGVALLTPIILTPIGGTLLAVSAGSPKDKIIFYMFISASVWAVLFSMGIYFFGDQLMPYLQTLFIRE